jgi:hypothetical protein
MAPRSRVQLQRKTCKWGDVAVWVEAAIRAEARAEEAEARAEEAEARANEMKVRAGEGLLCFKFLKRAGGRF